MSKTWPADDVRALAALGQRDFGENRVQELLGKAGELADLPLRWHFIGQLQRNKAAAVARLGRRRPLGRPAAAGPRPRPGRPGGRAAGRRPACRWTSAGRPGELAARGGRRPGRRRRRWPTRSPTRAGLRLRGLMAVAPRGEEPGPAFARLAALAARVRADHPGAVELSAGMSGDLEAAVAAGATVVRVGTALFGDRPLASGKIA